MGSSGIGLCFEAGSNLKQVEQLEARLWDDTLYSYLRSRCGRPHHLDLLHCEFLRFDVRREVEEDSRGPNITWWFSDYGPSICMHWIDMALAARREKVLAEAERFGLKITSILQTVEEALRASPYTLYIDTGETLLSVDAAPFRYLSPEESVMITEDLGGQANQRPLASLEPRVRRLVHRTVEAQRCGCPVCASLYKKTEGAAR